MMNKLAISVLLAALGTASANAQEWIGATTSISQVALDYDQDPVAASQKYRNVELVIQRAMVIGAPGRFPSGRSYLPVMGLDTEAHPVRAIVPSQEIPPGTGKGTELSMNCTAQGFYTPEGRAVQSEKDGLLVLSCGNLRVLR